MLIIIILGIGRSYQKIDAGLINLELNEKVY